METAGEHEVAFTERQPIAVEVVKVPRGSLGTYMRAPIPKDKRAIPLEVTFPRGSTLNELVHVMSSIGVQVGFRWDSNEAGEVLLGRRLPFRHYNGTLGGLISSLRTGLGVDAWYENDVIFLSDRGRYSVSLPQNEDVLTAVAEELTALGAEDVVTSMRGGKVVYTTRPAAQDEIIGPYLDRLTRNLSMVRIQVAVVSLSLSDTSSIGFDWNAFQIEFDSRASTIGTDGGDTDSGDAEPSSSIDEGSIAEITAGAISFGRTYTGDMFGTYGALSVASAVSFLSNFGNTNITQNVEMTTLSGTEMVLRSGQEVPYVSEIDVNSSGSSENLIGSAETDTVETGLTLTLKPHYDAGARLVTMGVDLKLKSILEFVNLSAGNQVGDLTQPLTQDQSLTNIIRMQAGKTAVIGGLQFNSEDYGGVEPAFLRDGQEQDRKTVFGKRSQQISRNALFIILRPTLTVFEPVDGLPEDGG